MPASASTRRRLHSCVVAGIGLTCAAGCYRSSALHVAAERNDVATIRRLVDEKHENADDALINKRTALHMAVARGNVEAAQTLLERGATVDAADNRGDTPLMMAANRGNLPIVTLLLSRRPSVNQTNKFGRTALMYAAKRGSPEVCEALLRAGADVRLRDDRGRSPLEYARLPTVRDVLTKPNARTSSPRL